MFYMNLLEFSNVTPGIYLKAVSLLKKMFLKIEVYTV